MSTKINLYKQTGTDTDTKISFNVPRSLTYGLNARANDDGGVSEADNCEYNILNSLFGISYEPLPIQPETAAYLAATGITGATEVNAINTMVYNLKQYGLWSKMKAVYPFVTDNRNLLSYTEDFSNAAWSKTRSSVSANTTTAPDGTLTADSLIEDTATGTHSTSCAFTTIALPYTATIYAKSNGRNWLNISFLSTTNAFAYFDLQNGVVGTIGAASTATITEVGNGWYRCSMTATTAVGSNTLAYYLASADNVVSYTGNGTSGIFVWGAQLELGSTATTYQPMLGSQQAYISNQFKYNLVNPVDSDAAFRLVFNGGWTFSSTGALPNGTNGYADTKLNGTELSVNSQALTYYSRTNTNVAAGVDMGIMSTHRNALSILRTYGGVANTSVSDISNSSAIGSAQTTSINNSTGYFIGSRTSATSNKLYRAGVSVASNTDNWGVSSALALPFFIGGSNSSGTASGFTNRQCAFASIGDGLTDTEAAYLYSITQQYQTFLNRAV